MTANPNGGEVQRYSYWINKDLIESVIAKA